LPRDYHFSIHGRSTTSNDEMKEAGFVWDPCAAPIATALT
jgi:hypothetical protein